MHIVEDASPMSLYDGPHYIDDALSRLAPFFHAKLKRLKGSFPIDLKPVPIDYEKRYFERLGSV